MLIQLNNIFKSYSNTEKHERKVLEGISLEVNEGNSIAIVGPSGCGKSTLLNIMGLLDIPNSGEVIFQGRDVTSLNENYMADTRNKSIGFVFQNHQLMPQLNLLENVLLPTLPLKSKNNKELKDRAMNLLKIVGLDDKIGQYPSQLSGGECQRTAVVRALINEPKLLLADEPTGSLDKKSAEQLGELLIKANQDYKLALVLVTHSLQLASLMKTQYQLEEGKIKM